MTYDQFISKIAASLEAAGLRADPEELKSRGLKERWVTGGMRGGSCYGSADEPRKCEKEPDSWILDNVLEAVCPAITFLVYKKLVAECVEYDCDREREYYGNSYEYTSKTADLRKVHDFLTTRGLI